MRHIAAGLVRLHLVENRTLRPEDTNPHRAHDLVAGKRQKVALELLYINSKMGHRLRRVNQDFGPNLVRQTTDLVCWINDSQHIRDMRKTHQLSALRELELQ